MRRIYSTPIQTCGQRWSQAALYNTHKPRRTQSKALNETKLQSDIPSTPGEIASEIERLRLENARMKAMREEDEADQRAARIARSTERQAALKALG